MQMHVLEAVVISLLGVWALEVLAIGAVGAAVLISSRHPKEMVAAPTSSDQPVVGVPRAVVAVATEQPVAS
jgi:hypothetical protein